MKAVEIRNLSEKELSEKLVDLKAELFHLRFQHAINRCQQQDGQDRCSCDQR